MKFLSQSLNALALLIFATAVDVAAQAVNSGGSGPRLFIHSSGSDVLQGRALMSELNCTACHSAEEELANESLLARPGPVLGAGGVQASPAWLRRFLLDPRHLQPGTPMPNRLHGLSAEERSAAVDDLVHHLMSLRKSVEGGAAGADPYRIHQGWKLYHSLGCVACHAPQEAPSSLAEGQAPLPKDPAEMPEEVSALRDQSIPLGDLARKYSVPHLADFLRNPHKARPAGRMPSFQLSENEALSVAMYLLREQAAGFDKDGSELEKHAGLKFQYFEGDFSRTPDLEPLQAAQSGFVANFSLEPRHRNENFGFIFTGLIHLPGAGRYEFYTVSDDGSDLWIGEEHVVSSWGHQSATERRGTIELAAGFHPIRVRYFNGGGDYSLRVLYEGPGIEKQPVPESALFYLGQTMRPLEREEFVLDDMKAAAGRERFRELNCAACHERSGPIADLGLNLPPMRSKPLRDLDHRTYSGCLARSVPASAPDYGLTDDQREQLRLALADVREREEQLPLADQLQLRWMAGNCHACHQRDGVGGPSAKRAEYFTAAGAGELDPGDEGRIPPALTGVGAKLKEDWLGQVLREGTKVRPYMAARMPVFDSELVDYLAKALPAVDAGTNAVPPFEPGFHQAKFGRKLAGTSGLSCIACHRFGDFDSLGMAAMDLTVMGRRLRKDWFDRYMIEPSKLRPGTRMPSFWPGGQAVNTDVLGGETQAQLDAIWAFLLEGEEANVPEGLIQGAMELVAEDEPVIYRNFIAGAGPRGIAVGYPEKVNLAFDADQMRLALIWQGAFIDAARHRTGRGAGFEPPLGHNVVEMAAGPSLAILANLQQKWPGPETIRKDFALRGYRLDKQRRPIFLYRFRSIQVEDAPVAVSTELDPWLQRTLTFRAEQAPAVVKVKGPGGKEVDAVAYFNDERREAEVGQLWLRAATADAIDVLKDGSYLVDKKVTMRFKLPAGVRPSVRSSEGRQELLVPVIFEGPIAKVVKEILW